MPLVHDMDVARIFTHPQQIEEEKHKERSREKKRLIIGDGNFSYDSLNLQGGGNGPPLPDCCKCGIKWVGECLTSLNDCFGCGKMDHKIWHFISIAKE